MPLWLERNSLRVEAHVLERASRPGYDAAGTTVTDEVMDGVDIKESHASSSADPAVEPSAEAGTTPAPVLKTLSIIKEFLSRLRELGAPIYGTKAAYKQANGEHYTHEAVPFAEIVLVRCRVHLDRER